MWVRPPKHPTIVMPGLSPGIHELRRITTANVCKPLRKASPVAGKLVDGRAKPGHDVERRRVAGLAEGPLAFTLQSRQRDQYRAHAIAQCY
jgi:hypothetical protein